MYDELTPVDIKKIEEELDYRILTLRPKILEDVKTARGFGDLSENFEYKAAKQERGRNESRIRYLQRMLRTAVVVNIDEEGEGIGLFDKVKIFIEEDEEEQDIQLVTTLRQNAFEGLISKESPLGAAIAGRKVGDRVFVEVSAGNGYHVVIRSIEKSEDDENLPIRGY